MSEVEGPFKPVTPGTLLITEPNATVAVRVQHGGLNLEYRFEDLKTGLADFTVLWRPPTQRLFLGGKRQSCVVNAATGRVEHVFEHCLFWGFSIDARPGFILETGELDCLLRRDDGLIVASTAVDPPWEVYPEPDGYRFSRSPSGVVARVWTESRVVTSVAGLTEQPTRAAFDAAASGWFRDGSYTWVRAIAGTTELRLAH